MRSVDPFEVRLNASLDLIEFTSRGDLRVRLREATHLGPQKMREPRPDAVDDLVDELISGSRPIQSGPGDRIIDLIWRAPAAHVVLDESFAGLEAPEGVPLTKALHVLADGAFREYLHANSYFGLIPEPATEYLLITLEAVVKVFSATPPEAWLVAEAAE